MKKIKTYYSKIMEDTIKSIPIKTRLYIHFTMNDYVNWVDGEYLGDKNKIKKEVDDIIEIIDEWVLNGMPK